MNLTFSDIAEAAPKTILAANVGEKHSITVDFMVLADGHIAIFGIEFKDNFSVVVNGVFD